VSEARLAQGALLPDASELRAVSARVAAAVVRHASERGIGRRFAEEEMERCVAGASWYPDYVPIVRA
jgi:malic enzyme